MRRGISDERAHKKSLIEQLAAKRKQHLESASKPRQAFLVSDSDDNDSDSYQIAVMQRKQLQRPEQPTAPAAQPSSMVRASLSTYGEDARDAADGELEIDLVAEMRGLDISRGPSKNAPNKNKNQQPAPTATNRPTHSGAASSVITADNAAPAQTLLDDTIGTTVDTIANDDANDKKCLVLGTQGERLSAELSTKLYPHQVVGVRWLWGLYEVGSGGILADDMGLGKTMQVSAFLSGLLKNRRGLRRRALIVAPKTLLAAWKKELAVCGLQSTSREYFGTAVERTRALDAVIRGEQGGVLLTTYGMLQHNAAALSHHEAHDADEDGPLWDLIIMDEGHKLKNPKMQLRRHAESLPARQRLLITGTPIQNNLMEMHALVDLVCPGLLGDAHAFKAHYERAITSGSDKHATVGERERAAALAATLRHTVAPYMLRREKNAVFGSDAGGGHRTAAVPESVDGTDSRLTALPSASESSRLGVQSQGRHSPTLLGALEQTRDDSISAGDASAAAGDAHVTTARTATLGRKNDFVVWLRLQPHQRALYEAFLNSKAVRAVLNRTSSALASLTVLKKICDHPALLSERAQAGIKSGAERAARKKAVAAMWAKRTGGGTTHAQGGRTRRRKARTNAITDSSDEDECESDASEFESGECDEEEKGEWYDDKNVKLEGGARFGFNAGSKQGGGGAGHSSAITPAGKAASNCSTQEALPAWLSDWEGSGMGTNVLETLHSTGLEASCKTLFVLALLRNLVAEGHRTLVFSQSRKMLDILEAGVRAEGWRMCRIDGGVASAAEREARVNAFQSDEGVPVFLLTSQVGGLGLTLTAADRVIIVDPAWNPSVDSQSVDRAYRIGQTRDVVVYRLISCGTVEDKIYRKQVFKGGLFRTGTEMGEQFRYFSAADLRDLFRLDPVEATSSSTQRQLATLHAHQRTSTPELNAHLDFLKTLQGFAGVSDHDLLYSRKEAQPVSAATAATAAHNHRYHSIDAGGQFGGASRPSHASQFDNRSARIASPARRRPSDRTSNNPNPLSFANAPSTGRGVGWSGGGDISDMFSKALTLNAQRASLPQGQGQSSQTTQQENGIAAPAGGASARQGPPQVLVGARVLPMPYDNTANNPFSAPLGGASVHRSRVAMSTASMAAKNDEQQLPPTPELRLATEISRVSSQLENQKALLSNAALLDGLADGGARLKARVCELEDKLEALQQRQRGLEAPSAVPQGERAANDPIAVSGGGGGSSSGSIDLYNHSMRHGGERGVEKLAAGFAARTAAQLKDDDASGNDSRSAAAPEEPPLQQPETCSTTVTLEPGGGLRELSVRKLKHRLYETARALQRAEGTGPGNDPGAAVRLRREVEGLNAQWQRARAARESRSDTGH